MMALADEAKFNSLEKPKAIQLMLEGFTVENDYLTPTFKMKRNVARERLVKEIDLLYKAPIMKAGKAATGGETKA